MGVTSALILDSGGPLVVPEGANGGLDMIRLQDGGFALVARHPTNSLLQEYDQFGAPVSGFASQAGNPSLAQLSDGEVITAFDSAGDVAFEGGDAVPFTFSSFFGTTNADIGAGPGGVFAVVSEATFSATESSIAVEIYTVGQNGAAPTLVTGFFARTGNSVKDSDASVAVLTNGNVAVAWTSTDTTTGDTDLLYAVYSATGAIVLGPTVLEGDNDVNRHASIAAKPDGGFAVAWESRVFSFASLDIRMQEFDANGVQVGDTLVSNTQFGNTGTDDGSDDANPFVAVNTDGTIAVSYTRTLDGDSDTIVAIVKGTSVVAERQVNFADDGLQQTGSAVAFFATGELAVFEIQGEGESAVARAERLSGSRDAAGDSDGIVSNDLIVGDAFRDLLNGLEGADTLRGEQNDDTLLGGGGGDLLSGGDGFDTIEGEDGNDTIEGGFQADTLRGGGGNDLIFGMERLNQTGSTAGDTLDGGDGNDTLTGANGADVFIGGADQDDMRGNDGADTMDGGTGNDTLNGGLGADSMTGGAGNDSYFVDSGADKTIETLAGAAGGTDTVFSTVNRTLSANIEILRLAGTANINGVGNELANQISGNGGANVLRGLVGADSLSGAAGADTLDGGADNDTLNGGAGADRMTGGTGNDTYYVDSGADQTLETTAGAAGGVDTVFSSVNRTLGDNLEILRLQGTGDIVGKGNALANTMFGNTGANTLLGQEGNDTLDGGAGNDTLRGDPGGDRMSGGTGDDVYYVDSGADQTLETTAGAAGGIDTVFSSVNRTLGANLENLTLTGAGDINGVGNELGNVITGNARANVLLGNAGADSLVGGAGNDRLNGGLGRDTLVGGAGNDELRGGTDGVDFFVFQATNNGNDAILDFNASQDLFMLIGAGAFVGRFESDNDTTLLLDSGGINTIKVLNVIGLSLGEWNDLIFTG